MFKSIQRAALVAIALTIPAAAFAQSTEGLTRAQVRAELVQVEQAGYQVGSGDSTTYPADIQAAEAKVAAENTTGNSAVGGMSLQGNSVSGHAARRASNDCVGPVSFCDIYRGS